MQLKAHRRYDQSPDANVSMNAAFAQPPPTYDEATAGSRLVSKAASAVNDVAIEALPARTTSSRPQTTTQPKIPARSIRPAQLPPSADVKHPTSTSSSHRSSAAQHHINDSARNQNPVPDRNATTNIHHPDVTRLDPSLNSTAQTRTAPFVAAPNIKSLAASSSGTGSVSANVPHSQCATHHAETATRSASHSQLGVAVNITTYSTLSDRTPLLQGPSRVNSVPRTGTCACGKVSMAPSDDQARLSTYTYTQYAVPNRAPAPSRLRTSNQTRNTRDMLPPPITSTRKQYHSLRYAGISFMFTFTAFIGLVMYLSAAEY